MPRLREKKATQRGAVERWIQQARRVRFEVVGQPLDRAGERRRAHREQHEQRDERWHERLGDSLDSSPDAAEQHRRRDAEDEEREDDAGRSIGRELGEEVADRLLVTTDLTGEREPDVGDRPSSNHAVEGQNARAGQHPETTDQPPAGSGANVRERANGRLLGAPTNRQLAEHDRKADEENADQIDEDEGRAAALTDLSWKPPDVSKSDGRTCCGEDESGASSPRSTVSCHCACLIGASPQCQPTR